MMTSRNLLPLLMTASFLLAATQPALAQTASPRTTLPRPAADPTNAAVPAAADPAQEDGEIVVTAQKRRQTLIEVPVSVIALGGEQLRETGVTDFVKLTKFTPGVIAANQLVGGRTVQTFTVRGIGNDDFRPVANPSVAVHFDGVYQGSSALIGGQMFDIDRVEILKGPQGTLYGRNTTAGAVNVIATQPTLGAGGTATLEYGSFNSARAEAALNVPLSATIAVRVSGVIDHTDGYVTNVGSGRYAGITPDPRIPPNGSPPRDDKAGRSTYRGGRALLAVGLDTPTRLTLNVHGFRETGLQQQGQRAQIANNAYTADAGYTYASNVVTPMRKTSYGGTATLNHALSDTVGLVVVGGYEHLAQRYGWNDGTPVRTYDIDYRDRLDQGSVEARLQSTAPGPVEWTVGGAYFRDRIRLISALDGSDVFRTIFDTDYLQKRHGWAVFGDGTWHLTDRLKLTGGLRYTREQSEYSGMTTDRNPYGTSIARSFYPIFPVAFDNRFSDGKLTGRAVASYSLTRHAELYASVNRGFKAGGFDGSTIFYAAKASPFRSEAVWAYEAGVKFLPRGGPVQIEASAFYYDYADLQANAVLQVGPNVFTSGRTNVGQARSFGGELSIVAHPVAPMTIRLGTALLDTRVTRIDTGSAAQIRQRLGNPLPNAPAMTLNGSVDYRIALSDRVALTPAVDARFVDNYFTEIDNYHAIGGYLLANARLTLDVDDHWTVTGSVRNLTDSFYANGALATTTQNVIFPGAPRSYAITAAVKF
ncbi:iron complex outermembrane receptor protein [Sphingomonas sp. BE270]|jgi:iron complex outermembrane receptor protein|uniref:TonB-dependent receptor n=1 Tax=Sphingomonas sp. BE270 TaxID=2817726 RepID=UPI002855DC7E|nr:TonB-dependent receptor [Sphingomonas sp. BE270]MDR7259910.1 iron complex outermembrane receptor protein [Sphingomonas sp. BE270]